MRLDSTAFGRFSRAANQETTVCVVNVAIVITVRHWVRIRHDPISGVDKWTMFAPVQKFTAAIDQCCDGGAMN